MTVNEFIQKFFRDDNNNESRWKFAGDSIYYIYDNDLFVYCYGRDIDFDAVIKRENISHIDYNSEELIVPEWSKDDNGLTVDVIKYKIER